VVLRSQLNAPVLALGQGGMASTLAPYVFFDMGRGSGSSVRPSLMAVSLGAGVDAQVGNNATATLDYAYTLRPAVVTRARDSKLEARLSVGF
jgi:hemolysin activation/secretion protein